MTNEDLQKLTDLSMEDLFDIADMCEKYMKLYNIIEGTRANFTNDRQLIDRFRRCITKGLEAPAE